jgi:drug/metabolite transporter (DMT)-like permease
VALVTAVVVFAPAAAFAWDVPAAALPYAAGSTALHLAYFALLAAAYRRADLSLVYPVARGLAPVLVLLGGASVLGRATSAGEAAGVVLVGVGVLLVRGLGREAPRAGVALAAAVALTIAAYTLVDNEGVARAAPLGYLELALAPLAFAYAAVLVRRRPAAVRRELAPSALLAGIAMFGAYALVLTALERASAAAVAAVRETSVVIAAVLAWTVLREPAAPRRLAGAVLVAAGVALVSVS